MMLCSVSAMLQPGNSSGSVIMQYYNQGTHQVVLLCAHACTTRGLRQFQRGSMKQMKQTLFQN